jgi:hypothetical protein
MLTNYCIPASSRQPPQALVLKVVCGCGQASYEKLTQLISDQSSLPQGVFTLLLGKIYKRKK